MKRGTGISSLAMVLLPIPAVASTDEFVGPVVCSLESGRLSYKVGDAPDLAVRIANNGERPIDLPGSLDGSEYKWRYPHTFFSVVGPGGAIPFDLPGRCGNTNGLRPQDFVRLEPADVFDPFMKVDDGGFWRSLFLGTFRFERPGEYVLTFHYSTNATDIAAWQGFPVCVNCPTGTAVVALVERVPKVSAACSLRVSVGD